MHSVAMAMVVETCAYEVLWPFALPSGYCVGNCRLKFIVAMAMVVMGDTCVQSTLFRAHIRACDSLALQFGTASTLYSFNTS